MFKKWPVRDISTGTFMVEAPIRMVDYDSVEIRVTLTPMRDMRPVERIGALAWATTLEAYDLRALEYVTHKLVENAMRVWRTGQD